MLRAVGFRRPRLPAHRRSASPRPGARSRPATCTSTAGRTPRRRAWRAAAARPTMFGTITVSDGISMGTPGMRYSLVSREVIADSIETVVGRAGLRRPRGDRRLRQEHARLHDGDRAARSAGRVRLRRHDPPGRRAARHRLGVRGGGRARARHDHRPAVCARWSARRSRARQLRRHVHREHDGLGDRGARHEPRQQLGAGSRVAHTSGSTPSAPGEAVVAAGAARHQAVGHPDAARPSRTPSS